MRMACRLDPKTSFQMAGEWLKYQLSTPVDSGVMNCKFFSLLDISAVVYQTRMWEISLCQEFEKHPNTLTK